MIIDQNLLDSLTAQAKANPRLRQAYDLRTEATEACPEPGRRDQSQRILNAVEPGTVLPIHRHRGSNETIVVLRGKVVQHYYDDNGNKIASFVLAPLVAEQGRSTNSSNNSNVVSEHVEGSEPISCAMSVPVGQWHALESLESGSVIFEAKDGTYEPLSEDDILNI